MDTNTHFNIFCKYFNSTKQINGHSIGQFLRTGSNYEQSYLHLKAQIITIDKLNEANFIEFLYKILILKNEDNQIVIDPTQVSVASFSFLKKILKDASKLNEDQKSVITEIVNKIESANANLEIESSTQNLNEPLIIYETQANDSNSITNPTINGNLISKLLDEFNIKFQKNFKDGFNTELKDELMESCNKTIHNELANEFQKHLGINKNLTSEEINLKKKKLANTINKVLVKNNHIKIYDSYIKSKAAPKCIEHFRFPYPLITDNDDIMKEYNKLIDGFQHSIMEFWKRILNQQIKELENDIRIHKEILKHHVENIEDFTTELYKTEEESLKSQFNKSNQKCEFRLTNKPVKFSIENLKKQNSKQNKASKNKTINKSNATKTELKTKPSSNPSNNQTRNMNTNLNGFRQTNSSQNRVNNNNRSNNMNPNQQTMNARNNNYNNNKQNVNQNANLNQNTNHQSNPNQYPFQHNYQNQYNNSSNFRRAQPFDMRR